jgi:glycine betaine/proline transport system permease protein
MEEWITGNKLPLGQVMKQIIEYLKVNAQGFFDAIKDSLTFVIEGLTNLLLMVPPLILIVAIALFALWLQRSWKLALFIFLAFLLITNLGYWEATVQTIALVGSATLVSVMIGVPVGIAAAHRPWLYTALHPILDLMQTLPTFVYLIPTLVFFGLGVAPGLISTVIFAIPAPIRLTHLGISSVPPPLKEAGEAFGATKSQLLWKVEIPHAMPTIMAGVTQCIMLSLSMVVIAALVGADGLGKPVVRALNQVNIPMGFEAGIAIVLLAIVLDRVCKSPERRSSH